jgi:hypothetical protein
MIVTIPKGLSQKVGLLVQRTQTSVQLALLFFFYIMIVYQRVFFC